jgi:3-dehydroquinate synthase
MPQESVDGVKTSRKQHKEITPTAPSPAKTVCVKLDKRSYNIVVRSGIVDDLGRAILRNLKLASGSGRTAAVLINPKVENYYGDRIFSSLESAGFSVLPIVLVAGEAYKTLQTVRRIYTCLYEKAVDRRTLVVAVGGGVIGDVAGFVAATYLRGLDFIQVPTTLLAQVDSSVGGKVGVNFENAKNLVGAFYQPKLVLIDPNTLRSLPFRERRSGLAEIIKYGAIADEALYHRLESELPDILRLRSNFLIEAIARSCQIKADIVSQDERDEGIRAILNFGHSVGHAMEAVTGYHVYRHGEAIAIGMVSACLIGEQMGITDKTVTESLVRVLKGAGFPVRFDERFYVNDVIRLLTLDKKAVNGAVRFVLLERLGQATGGHFVPEETIREALLRQRGI